MQKGEGQSPSKVIKMELIVNYVVEKVEFVGNTCIATIVDNDSGEVFVGKSRCNGLDTFSFDIGAQIAIRRAVKEMFNAHMDWDIEVIGNKDDNNYSKFYTNEEIYNLEENED